MRAFAPSLACRVSFGSLLSFVLLAGVLLAGVLLAGAPLAASAFAADKAPVPAAASSTATPAQNKCGCYEDSAGACHCAKKNRCGCPGECEPAGCEQKRQKQHDKETAEELKRQQSEDKKRNAELTKKREELDRKDDEKRERGGLRGLRLIEQPK